MPRVGKPVVPKTGTMKLVLDEPIAPYPRARMLVDDYRVADITFNGVAEPLVKQFIDFLRASGVEVIQDQGSVHRGPLRTSKKSS